MTQIGSSTPSTPASSRLPLPPRINSIASSAKSSTELDPFRGSAGLAGIGAGSGGAGAGAGEVGAAASSLSRNMSMGRSGKRSGVGGAADDGWREPKGFVPTNPTKRRWLFFGVPIFLLLAAGVGVSVGVGVTQSRRNSSAKSDLSHDASSTPSASSGAGETGSETGTASSTGAVAQSTQTLSLLRTGTDGSTVTMDDGTNFTYTNSFGGSWAVDPSNPYNVSVFYDTGSN